MTRPSGDSHSSHSSDSSSSPLLAAGPQASLPVPGVVEMQRTAPGGYGATGQLVARAYESKIAALMVLETPDVALLASGHSQQVRKDYLDLVVLGQRADLNATQDTRTPYFKKKIYAELTATQFSFAGVSASKNTAYKMLAGLNWFSVMLEVFFAVFLYITTKQGVEAGYQALSANEVLGATPGDFDAFRDNHPVVAMIALVFAVGGAGVGDLFNNVAMVDPNCAARETLELDRPITLYERSVDRVREHHIEVPADDVLPVVREVEDLNLSRLGQVKVMLATYLAYIVGSSGDLVPFAAPASESPAFLARPLVRLAQNNVGFLAVLGASFMIGGLAYYKMYMHPEVIKGVKAGEDGHLSSPDNRAGEIEAKLQSGVNTVLRGIGFGYIGVTLSQSPHFANWTGGASYFVPVVLGTFLGGINTWYSRIYSSAKDYMGTPAELELNVPARSRREIIETMDGGDIENAVRVFTELEMGEAPERFYAVLAGNAMANDARTYRDLAKARINNLNCVKRHWEKALGAFVFGGAFGAFVGVMLDEKVSYLSGRKYLSGGNAIGLALGVSIFAVKLAQGVYMQQHQFARIIYNEDQAKLKEAKLIEVGDDVRAKVQTLIQEGDHVGAKALADKYEKLFRQTYGGTPPGGGVALVGHFKRAQELGSDLGKSHDGPSYRATAMFLNGFAQSARYFSNVLFGVTMMPKIPGVAISPRAAVYFMMIIALQSAVSNFVFGVGKTEDGIGRAAKGLKKAANCCLFSRCSSTSVADAAVEGEAMDDGAYQPLH